MEGVDIIRLAREAGVKPLLYDGKWAVEGLDVFAALVAAAEREACVKVCERLEQEWEDAELWASFKAAGFLIDAIRSRE